MLEWGLTQHIKWLGNDIIKCHVKVSGANWRVPQTQPWGVDFLERVILSLGPEK